MIRSFLWRAYLPQVVLLVAVLSALDAWPIPDGPRDDWFSVAVHRGSLMIVASAATWVVGMVLTGYFQGDFRLPKFPTFGSTGEKKEAQWVFIAMALWLGGMLLLLFVALIGIHPVPFYVIQLLAYLLCSIGLFNVFTRTLGPAIVEAQKQEKERAKVTSAAARVRAQIREAEEEIERLQNSPLANEVEDSILQLQSKARRLRQELEIIEGGA